MFGLVTPLVRSDLSKDVELLVFRHENRCCLVTCPAGRGGITPIVLPGLTYRFDAAW
jgi:hypothetical protein